MKRIILILVSLVCLVIMNVVLAAPKTNVSKNACVAVMDFGTRPGATPSEISINNAEYTSCEYIINRFVDRNCFTVRDKELVMNSLKAEGLKTTGIIDPDTAKRIGQLLKVKYIVYGNVNNVSVSETGTAIVGTVCGGVNVCTVKASIIARIMDVDTGRILMMARGDGKSKSSYVNVSASKSGLKSGVLTLGTVKVTQDSVHNAIQKAAFSTVDDLMFKLFGDKKLKI